MPDHFVHDTGVELYDTDGLRGDVLVHVIGDGDVGEAVANEFPAGRKAIFGGVEDFGIVPRLVGVEVAAHRVRQLEEEQNRISVLTVHEVLVDAFSTSSVSRLMRLQSGSGFLGAKTDSMA